MRLIAGNPGKSLILQITEPDVERLREGLDNLLYMTERPSRISEPDRAAVEDLISELQRVRVEFHAAAAAADSADDAAEAAAWVAYDAAIAAIVAARATHRETKAAEAAAAESAGKGA